MRAPHPTKRLPRLTTGLVGAAVGVLASAVLASEGRAQDGGSEPPEPIPVELHVRTEWVTLDADRLPPGNRSALAVKRFVDPATGKPFDDRADPLGVATADLVRGFRLEKTELLLGEPLLVEFRIEVTGEGTFREPVGGAYRGLGRDDNFVFILRRKDDGTFVPDAYGERIFGHMGGISTVYDVESGKPRSHWHAVARYAPLVAPGEYELFCLQHDHRHDALGRREALIAGLPDAVRAKYDLAPGTQDLIDRKTGEKAPLQLSPSWRQKPAPSPLAALVPAELRKEIARRAGFEEHQVLTQLADYARFDISVVAPTDDEQRETMVDRWTGIAARRPGSWPNPRSEAARQALFFSRGELFLPWIEGILDDPDARGATPPQDIDGLALNPSPRAFDLLARATGEGLGSLFRANEAHRERLVPLLLQRLVADEARARAEAFSHLARIAERRFDAPWGGFRADRPTPEEAAAIAERAAAWWRTHGPGGEDGDGR